MRTEGTVFQVEGRACAQPVGAACRVRSHAERDTEHSSAAEGQWAGGAPWGLGRPTSAVTGCQQGSGECVQEGTGRVRLVFSKLRDRPGQRQEAVPWLWRSSR